MKINVGNIVFVIESEHGNARRGEIGEVISDEFGRYFTIKFNSKLDGVYDWTCHCSRLIVLR